MKAGVIGATLAFLLMIGFPVVSFAGTTEDTDSDGVTDFLDNCKDVSNAAQVDSDGDGCGNRCDADWNQSGDVGIADFTLWSNDLGDTSPGPPFNAAIDSNVNGAIGIGDFTVWSNQLGGPPGPSGFTDDCP